MDDFEGPSETMARDKALSPNQQQMAHYIADMAIELSRLAEKAGFPLLRDKIEAVADEAMREVAKPRHFRCQQ